MENNNAILFSIIILFAILLTKICKFKFLNKIYNFPILMRQKCDTNQAMFLKKYDRNQEVIQQKSKRNATLIWQKSDINATVIDSNETEIRLKYYIYMRHKRNRNATKIRHKCYIKATDMRQ